MKKQRFVLLGLGLLVGMSAYAQTVNLKADVPFDFIIRGATLPAGEYTIQGLGDGPAIAVRGPNPKANTICTVCTVATVRIHQRCKTVQAGFSSVRRSIFPGPALGGRKRLGSSAPKESAGNGSGTGLHRPGLSAVCGIALVRQTKGGTFAHPEQEGTHVVCPFVVVCRAGSTARRCKSSWAGIERAVGNGVEQLSSFLAIFLAH